MGSLVKIIVLCFVPLVACQYNRNYQQPRQQLEALPEHHEILDIETPEVFAFTASPLQKPESLQSRPYFDFLSTLYRHDEGKKSLFVNPPRYRREPVQAPVRSFRSGSGQSRQKRAVVFRPLFVYRQQEIRKQKIQSLNKVRRH
ncbi:uncharacterized protein LOC129952219 isoform X1 [Eupeodes corollae]|uniref:uncharacterized protein LOC129952219 isoform X1 n=1 Tax=Eupeodes corollae TaxID=290404 RepID=UPI002492281B|nr:uncharacterized protein LOC129952219 isoform X1 [Eupeodes corollae]